MATLGINIDNFKPTIAGSGIVRPDFWAAWCGPCPAFEPVFETVSQSMQERAR